MVKISLSVLKKRYAEAVEGNLTQITIKTKGEELVFLTTYLKYLIEHLENVYKARGLRDTVQIEVSPQEKKGDTDGTDN